VSAKAVSIKEWGDSEDKEGRSVDDEVKEGGEVNSR
jgi:hypothetical protein